MDKRFFNMFNLTEDQAIALLKKPLEELKDKSERYVAASHLINYPTQRSITALVETIEDTNPELYHRIARRKAVESLGRMQVSEALPVISSCLKDEDCYTVENAVWAIGEIGTEDKSILKAITQLLQKPDQSYRVIIQTLAKLDYQDSLDQIKPFTDSDDEPIRSAAIATVARFTGDYSKMEQVVAFLTHESVNARRACIQDLIDAKYYGAIPQIAKCPVSMVFRLRGIRLLGETGLSSGAISFTDIEPSLDQVIRDHPQDLEMVHEYDQKPSLEFLISELYHTDFGRCYLATQTLLEEYPQQAPVALEAAFADKAYNDYGGHYHVMKLFGWLNYADAYNILVEQGLHNQAPQFRKSRAAAALALGNLGDPQAIRVLKEALKTKIFDLKYACLLALEKLGSTQAWEIVADDPDPLIRSKVKS